MKYIILETQDGRQLPIIFPECLTHCFVAGAMQLAVDTLDPEKDLRPKQLDQMLERGTAKAVSAGFVSIDAAACNGESESLGGVKSRGEIDVARIMLGDAAAFMPDGLMLALVRQAQANRVSRS